MEFRRKLFHLVFGLFLIALLKHDIINVKILLLVFVAGLIISQVSRKIKVPGISWFLENFERPESLKTFPGKGALFLVLGVIVAVVLFEKDIALASVAVLSVGDSVSNVVGSNFGRVRHPFSRNSLVMIEGSIAGTIAAFAVAMLFVSPLEALAAAVVAMIAEVMEMRINDRAVDDNVVVPLVAGAAIHLLRRFSLLL